MRIGPVGQPEELIVREVHVDANQPTAEPKKVDFEDVQKAIDTVQRKLEKFKEVMKSEAEFKIDRKTGMVIVKIKDRETGEVIRQIPPEVVVKLAKTIEEFLGLLFDERA